MGIISELFGKKNDNQDILISKKEFDEKKLNELNKMGEVSVLDDANNTDSTDSTDSSETKVPEGAFINSKGEIEYKTVEIEIHPAKIICPDCGGITIEGLEYCDKCGGELF